MAEFLTQIDYDLLINQNLMGVVKDALKIASTQGLPGENHFYITFQTNVPGVKIPAMLKTQYPESMTIVLQHQFYNLAVEAEKFSVTLVFGGIEQELVIPFKAITYFADPFAKFGLSFALPERATSLEDLSPSESAPAEVISIDKFRKSK